MTNEIKQERCELCTKPLLENEHELCSKCAHEEIAEMEQTFNEFTDDELSELFDKTQEAH
jgi:hypothetical protein